MLGMTQHVINNLSKCVLHHSLHQLLLISLPMPQVVPFCGVFLKELSDALDGTASIISLKPPPDNSEDAIDV